MASAITRRLVGPADDVDACAAFYDAVLRPFAGARIMDLGEVIGHGVPPMPDSWLGPQQTGTGFRECHRAFSASNRATVDQFFAAAQALGAEVLLDPLQWPEYHPDYCCGAFVCDSDGNDVEAVCHQPE